MIFVSIVGNQLLATLNPILALNKANRRPKQVVLLFTDNTKEYVGQLRQVLVDAGYFESQIETVLVSNSLANEESGPAAHSFCRGLVGNDEVLFNVTGGMNFQIAASTLAIPSERLTLVYPEHNGVHLLKFANGVAQRESLPLPETVDVLALQKVPYSPAQDNDVPLLLKRLLASGGKGFPRPNRIRIGGVTFDLTINNRNRMTFLTTVETKKGDSGLEKARRVIALASSRTAFGELYDRDIFVVTNSSEATEHLRTEANSKVKVIHVDGPNPFAVKQLNFLLSGTVSKAVKINSRTETIETANKVSSRTRLYLCLGTNLLPTLKAIWTHRPAEVCLIYTPEDDNVQRLRDSIGSAAKYLPTERIIFFPCSMTAEEIFDLPLPPEGMNIEANISPGTKLQGALLSLWASINSGKVYSLDNNAGISSSLNNGKSKKVQIPPPAAYLELHGEKLFKAGPCAQQLRKSLRARLPFEFMESLHRKIGDIGEFPYRNMNSDGLRLVQDKPGVAKVFTMDGKAATVFHSNKGGRQGFWFEELVGYAFAAAGIDVQINLATAQSDQLLQEQKKRREKKGLEFRETHKSELDVVVWHAGGYHLVSCKLSGNDASAHVREAEAQAKILGRFTIALVACLDHKGPPMKKSGTWFFGPATLVNSQALRELLDTACREKSTTSQHQ